MLNTGAKGKKMNEPTNKTRKKILFTKMARKMQKNLSLQAWGFVACQKCFSALLLCAQATPTIYSMRFLSILLVASLAVGRNEKCKPSRRRSSPTIAQQLTPTTVRPVVIIQPSGFLKIDSLQGIKTVVRTTDTQTHRKDLNRCVIEESAVMKALARTLHHNDWWNDKKRTRSKTNRKNLKDQLMTAKKTPLSSWADW